MLNVDINQAKESLPELIEKTISYGDVIITKDGKPIAKLLSIPEIRKQRRFGTTKGLIKLSHDFDQDWYLENTRWVQEILNGTYMEYYRRQCGERLQRKDPQDDHVTH